jgi:hypothetical protein
METERVGTCLPRADRGKPCPYTRASTDRFWNESASPCPYGFLQHLLLTPLESRQGAHGIAPQGLNSSNPPLSPRTPSLPDKREQNLSKANTVPLHMWRPLPMTLKNERKDRLTSPRRSRPGQSCVSGTAIVTLVSSHQCMTIALKSPDDALCDRAAVPNGLQYASFVSWASKVQRE